MVRKAEGKSIYVLIHVQVCQLKPILKATHMYANVCGGIQSMIDECQHTRPVINIDGTYLKGMYNEKLLIEVTNCNGIRFI